MVKSLFVLRHGHAEQPFGKNDMERKITRQGEEKVAEVAALMKKDGTVLQQVCCSPADRTRQTLALFLAGIGQQPEVQYNDEVYEASLKTLLLVIGATPETVDSLLLVGHNPGLSYLVEYLLDERFYGMDPGDLVRIDFEDQTWAAIGKGTGIRKSLG